MRAYRQSYIPRASPSHYSGLRSWWARFKPGTDNKARKLLKQCERLPHCRQLVKMRSLRKLADLVRRRTALTWKRWQYRDQHVGLVAYLMAWFPNQETLLLALERARCTGQLPVGYVPTFAQSDD